MNIIKRLQAERILKGLTPNKVVLLLGPRRVGKTVMIKQLIKKIDEPYVLLNGEDQTAVEILAKRSVQNYRNLLGETRFLVIDEAQKIPEIGNVLKLIVDEIPGIRILVTGSSAFDISKNTGEPLTGRKKTFHLFPLSESEFDQIETMVQKKDNLCERLVYGNYPELIHRNDRMDKVDYLREMVNSYLLKDILAFETIQNSDKIFRGQHLAT